jgi:hypothetical protein
VLELSWEYLVMSLDIQLLAAYGSGVASGTGMVAGSAPAAFVPGKIVTGPTHRYRRYNIAGL